MKKQGIYISIIAIIMAVYSVLSILLTSDRNAIFWIGYGFLISSLIVLGFITLLSTSRRSAAFPIEISTITFSGVYVLCVFVVNLIFGYIFHIEPRVFTSIQIICLGIFTILTLLLQLTKAGIIKQNNDANGKIYEVQILMYDFEKIKSKLSDMPEVTRKKSVQLIDSLLDELHFSDFSSSIDVSDLDNKIRFMATSLSSEADNLIQIQADDLSAFEMSVNEIKQLIQDRNRQIKLLNSGI